MAIEIFPSTPAPPTPSVASTTVPSDQLPQPPTPSSSSWAMNMISPRISFSHDLNRGSGDVIPVEPHLPLNPSSLVASANFNFYYPNNIAPFNDRHFQSSSADELFCDGVLRPLETLNIRPSDKSQQQQPPTAKTRRLASLVNPNSPPPTRIGDGSDKQLSQQEQQSSTAKSFWKFKRSRSFHCGSIYGGTLCPLPLLSRSKSTGSNSSSKRSLVLKEEQGGDHHQGNRKLGGCGRKQRNSSPSFATGRHYTSKNQSYCHRHSVSPNITMVVSPVLNVPAGNLFGIGSIFCGSGGGRKRGVYYDGKNKKKTGI